MNLKLNNALTKGRESSKDDLLRDTLFEGSQDDLSPCFAVIL